MYVYLYLYIKVHIQCMYKCNCVLYDDKYIQHALYTPLYYTYIYIRYTSYNVSVYIQLLYNEIAKLMKKRKITSKKEWKRKGENKSIFSRTCMSKKSNGDQNKIKTKEKETETEKQTTK